MSMTTRCPSCATTFRVTPQQLQSQHGMVRCGRCATVFDGFKALATLGEAAFTELAPRELPAAAEVQAVATEPFAAEPATVPSVGAETFVASDDEILPVPETPAPAAETMQPVAETASTQEIKPEPLPESEPEIMPVPALAQSVVVAEPEFVAPAAEYLASYTAPAPQPKTRRNAGWALGAAVLLLVFGAQLLYLNRGDIAAAMPEARPFLNGWCKSLRCTVALPQHPRQISIEASDMQAADTTNPGLIILTATLRNQATIALGYPALDVVLTNTREHTVARRIFLPVEYLADNKDLRAGMAPSAEITIRLNIDSGDLGAAGFRLDLMAAPAS